MPRKHRRSLLQYLQDAAEHVVQVLIHIDIVRAVDGIALCHQELCPAQVMGNLLVITMSCAVDFDHELFFPTQKIHHIASDRDLAVETETLQLAFSEKSPQALLRRGLVVSQCPRKMQIAHFGPS